MTVNKIFFISLGCDKNRIDSEEMLGYLRDAGFSFTYDETEADIIVINTCAFIDPAKQESIDTILEMAELKETGRLKKLIVAGCLAERYADEIMKELPEIDAIIGVNELPRIAEVVKSLFPDIFDIKEPYDRNRKINRIYLAPDQIDFSAKPKRLLTTGGHYEFLKIAEGCSKCCTYCAIPKIRGPYRSFPIEALINEAVFLADSGVKELILVAQETTIYGTDIYGREMLTDLLKELSDINGIDWIRVLYAYPEDISKELLETIASLPKVCNYIDMPIQHASDRILKLMGRRTNKEKIKNTIALARTIMPDVALRTSLISGFPSETEEEHNELKEFISEIQFDRLGVFSYSKEDGTAAAKFKDQIPARVKTKRRNELMKLQNNINTDKTRNYIGKSYDVFIEGRLSDESVYIGRTYMDAPDVDGCFFVNCNHELMSGDIIRAKVTSVNEYDMIGVIEE